MSPARTAVLHNGDLLALILLHMPAPKVRRDSYKHEMEIFKFMRTYASVAKCCRAWYDILRGKEPGLRDQACAILRRFLVLGGDLQARYGGSVPRPRFCAAMGISVAKANAVPEARGRQPYLTHDGLPYGSGGLYKMPEAFDYVIEAEGGWVGLLNRFQSKVKRKQSAEERKEVMLAATHEQTLADLRAALQAMDGCVSPSAQNDLDQGTWKRIDDLKSASTAFREAKAARLHHARQMGGGKLEALQAMGIQQ
jgi:hypothetical protein